MSAFRALGLPDDFVTLLASRGIAEPTAIQAAVIPDQLAGLDICGRAPTGSGKTLAFGLPLALALKKASRRRPTGLVLAPTRELAQQIAEAIRPFAERRKRSIVAVYGGVGYGAQRKALDAGVDLVVACPGRLEDLLQMGALSLADIEHVVIDEADRMADMGFLPSVRRIVAATAAHRRVHLYSATFDGAVGALSKSLQTAPARHEVGDAKPDITKAHHVFWKVDREQRTRHTATVVEELGSTMVFCRTRHGADRLAKQLAREGIRTAAIHGGRSQAQRDRALQDFANGSVAALVATDVAARGVHVDDVAAVVHFDPPADAATYVHRSGRTARASASGVVVSLVEPAESKSILAMQRKVGIDVQVQAVSTEHLRAPRQHVARAHRVEPQPAPVATASAPPAKGERSTRAAATPAVDVARSPLTGTVKAFNARRGFGFISHEGGDDLFVHISNVQLANPASLTAGQTVRFAIGEGRRGAEAMAVQQA